MFGKKKAGAIAAGLSLVMALAPVTPALADDTAVQTADITKGVTKVLQVNPGSNVTATFKYTATPTVLNAGTAQATETHTVTATIADIELSANGAQATDTAAITYGTFGHAGTYAWTVKETADTYEGTGEMQYDPESYTLVAVVENGVSGPELKQSYLIKGTAATTSGDKVGTATFTNKYTEKTDDKDEDGQSVNSPLVVTKTVTGPQGDKTKDFNFTVTFTAPTVLPKDKSAADVLNDITATAVEGATVTEQAKATGNTRTFKFTAKDAKSVTFDSVLVGTNYTVSETEAGQAGYTTTYKLNDTEFASTASQTVNDNANTVVVNNDKQGSVVTGVIVNNAPFIVMIGAAAAGVVAYGSAKRKLEK